MISRRREGWRRVRLDRCCEVVSGSTPRRDHPEYWNGDIAWATPRDLSVLDRPVLSGTAERITQAGYESCPALLMEPGAVLFSSRAPVGLVAIAGISVCTNQGFKSFVPGPDVDSGYLYWCLKRYGKLIAARGSGSTFTEVSKAVVSRFEIPLPALDEQRRIAALLDKADAVRRKRKEAIGLLDEFLRSAFLEMFGDPVRNERGWEVKELGSVSEIASGLTKGRRLRGQETTPVPYLRVANVQDGFLELDEMKTIDATIGEVSKYALSDGDILLTEGGDPDKLGRGAVWRGEIEGCIHQNHVFRVRLTDRGLKPDYVAALLGSAYGKRYFLKAAKQTTGIASINRRQLSRFPVLRAPATAQERYTAVVMKHAESMQRLSHGHETADDLFNSLAQRVFGLAYDSND